MTGSGRLWLQAAARLKLTIVRSRASMLNLAMSRLVAATPERCRSTLTGVESRIPMKHASIFSAAIACTVLALPTAAAAAKGCAASDIVGEWQMTTILEGKQAACLFGISRSGEISKNAQCAASPSTQWELSGTISVDDNCEITSDFKLKRDKNTLKFRGTAGLMLRSGDLFTISAIDKDDKSITNFLALRDRE